MLKLFFQEMLMFAKIRQPHFEVPYPQLKRRTTIFRRASGSCPTNPLHLFILDDRITPVLVTLSILLLVVILLW